MGDPWIIKFILQISGGLIKNRKQAERLLVALSVLAILLSGFLIFGRDGSSPAGGEYKPNTEYGGKNLPDNFK